MSQTNDTFWGIALLVILAIPFILLFIAVFWMNIVKPFLKEKEYIKMEMGRSNEEEYQYWKRELKKLYIWHIPLVGPVIYRNMRKRKKGGQKSEKSIETNKERL